jgi:hypothetical protein
MFQKMPGPKAYLNSLLLLRKPVKYISNNADFVFSYGSGVTDVIKKIGVTATKIIEIDLQGMAPADLGGGAGSVLSRPSHAFVESPRPHR